MFRIYAYTAVLAALIVAVSIGTMTIPVAVLFALLTGASLTNFSHSRTLNFVCPTPFDALRIATENLPNDIYTKASWGSIWFNYIKRSVFPRNTGVNQTVFVIGNSEPTSNTETWNDLTLSSNVINGVCANTYTDVDVGYNEVNYVPRQFGLRGPVICHDTLTYAHNPAQFIAQYIREMTKRARRSWEFQFRNMYMQLASKLIARPGSDITAAGASFPLITPTSQLTWGILDTCAQSLMQIGASDADQEWIELGPDGPVFPLVIGATMKQRLFTNVQSIRDDVRYAQMGMGDKNLLFRRIGATDVHKNFRLVPDLLPPRFSFTPGVGYSQVATYEMVAASEGTVAHITSAYKNALYEGAIILHPMVMEAAMVQPFGAGLDWDPINYMGEWIWKTTADGPISDTYCYDPLGKRGRHFAEFTYAPKPIFPEYGITIIYRCCPNDSDFAACSYA